MPEAQAPTRAPRGVFDDYAARLGGCHVILGSPQSCLDVLRSLEQSVAAIRRQGLRPPVRVLDLMALLQAELDEQRASVSAGGSAEVPREPQLPQSQAEDLVDVAEAARMLNVSARQVRNLGELLEGRKAGRVWVFERGVLAAEASRRRQERRSA